jgi:outer membrane protein assembly factor BamB
MRFPSQKFAPFLLIVLIGFPSHASENWPGFRGPGSKGAGPEATSLPIAWSATENVVWKTDIPGLGWACPVVWGDKLFLTTVTREQSNEAIEPGLYFGGERGAPEDKHTWWVFCLSSETGEVLWKKAVHEGVPASSRHNKNTFASETPVVDGEAVYAYFGNTGLYAFDHQGNPLWEQKFEPVETRYGWGTAASPVLHENLLIIVNDNEGQSWIAALDKKSGEEIWRKNREEGSNWSTPLVWENEMRTEIVTVGTDQVRSYDLEGNVLWTLSGMSANTIPTPFAHEGLLYVASGFIMDQNRPVYAIKPGASGDISLAEGETSNEFIVWTQPKAAPYNPSMLAYGDYLYVLLDRGFLSCYNAKSGEEVYDRERIDKGVAFTASPWAYKDKIFCLSESGKTYVIAAGPDFKVAGTNDLEEFSMSCPAIADGALFIRTQGRVYRLEQKTEADASTSAP